jgi:hypothetical protein
MCPTTALGSAKTLPVIGMSRVYESFSVAGDANSPMQDVDIERLAHRGGAGRTDFPNLSLSRILGHSANRNEFAVSYIPMRPNA